MINYLIQSWLYLVVWFKTTKSNGVNEYTTSDEEELTIAKNNAILAQENYSGL